MNAPSRSLVALAAIALLEGAALIVYGVYDSIQALRIGATGPAEVSNGPAIVIQIVIFLIFGAGLIWVARGWWRGKRWARGPFVLAQFIALVVGIPLVQAQGSLDRIAGAIVTVVAIAGLILVFTPSVTRQTQR